MEGLVIRHASDGGDGVIRHSPGKPATHGGPFRSPPRPLQPPWPFGTPEVTSEGDTAVIHHRLHLGHRVGYSVARTGRMSTSKRSSSFSATRKTRRLSPYSNPCLSCERIAPRSVSSSNTSVAGCLLTFVPRSRFRSRTRASISTTFDFRPDTVQSRVLLATCFVCRSGRQNLDMNATGSQYLKDGGGGNPMRSSISISWPEK